MKLTIRNLLYICIKETFKFKNKFFSCNFSQLFAINVPSITIIVYYKFLSPICLKKTVFCLICFECSFSFRETLF